MEKAALSVRFKTYTYTVILKNSKGSRILTLYEKVGKKLKESRKNIVEFLLTNLIIMIGTYNYCENFLYIKISRN